MHLNFFNNLLLHTRQSLATMTDNISRVGTAYTPSEGVAIAATVIGLFLGTAGLILFDGVVKDAKKRNIEIVPASPLDDFMGILQTAKSNISTWRKLRVKKKEG